MVKFNEKQRESLIRISNRYNQPILKLARDVYFEKRDIGLIESIISVLKQIQFKNTNLQN